MAEPTGPRMELPSQTAAAPAAKPAAEGVAPVATGSTTAPVVGPVEPAAELGPVAADLRLVPSLPSRLALIAAGGLALVAPLSLTDFWLSVLNFAGIFAIGALGLNLLTGYAGQVSLGHAFFMALGAYVCAHAGGEWGLPFLMWLPLAGVVGGSVGALVGPFALRLRGNYLAIVSLGLVFIGLHIWNNAESFTGGAAGIGGLPSARLGPLDFGALEVGGRNYTRDQAYFWLIWGLVAGATLVTRNVVRSRPGRALQAVRDGELAASVIGVNVARYKVGAFVLSSALAAVAGALYGSYVSYVSPEEWGLRLSIQFVAIIVVGGVGTVFGSILGAIFLGGVPRLVEQFSDRIPLITGLGLSVEQLNQLLFGAMIVLFLMWEPRGMAGVGARLTSRLRARPAARTIAWPWSSRPERT